MSFIKRPMDARVFRKCPMCGEDRNSYLPALQNWRKRRSVSAEMIATAYVSNRMPFTDLPYVGKTFLGLLLLSHGGYLVFKARQTNDAAGATQTPK